MFVSKNQTIEIGTSCDSLINYFKQNSITKMKLNADKNKFIFEMNNANYELEGIEFFRTVYVYAKANDLPFDKTLEVIFSNVNWEEMMEPNELFMVPIEEAKNYSLPVLIGHTKAIFLRPDIDPYRAILDSNFLSKFEIYKVHKELINFRSCWIKRRLDEYQLDYLRKKYNDFIDYREPVIHKDGFFFGQGSHVFFFVMDNQVFVPNNF